MSNLNVMRNLLVKYLPHGHVVLLDDFSFLYGTHWSLNGPAFVRIVLSFRMFLLFRLASPLHLLFPIFVVLALLFLFLQSFTLLVKSVLLYLVLEFLALSDRLVAQSFKALLFSFNLGILLVFFSLARS